MDHYTFNTSIVHVFSTFLYFDKYINEKEGEKERDRGGVERGRKRQRERVRCSAKQSSFLYLTPIDD